MKTTWNSIFTTTKNNIIAYSIDINNRKSYSDYMINDIRNYVYDLIDKINYDWNLYDILWNILDQDQVQELLSYRIRNNWLYEIDKVNDIDLDQSYFKLDWYDNIENIDYMDILDRIENIINEIDYIESNYNN